MSTVAVMKPFVMKNMPTIGLNRYPPKMNKSHTKQQGINPTKEKKNTPSKKVSASAPTTPQQRRTVLPVKQRRVERRKEIKSMTEAILHLDLPSSSSSSESDDSLDTLQQKRPNIKKKKSQGNKKHHSASPSPVLVHTLSTLITKKESNSRNRRRSTSAVDSRSSATVYAGPTFNNAPAPSALPLPAFSYSTNTHLQQHSRDLMNLLSHSHQERSFEQDLSQIQRDLRSMLKI
ncbi:uncharacterized protein B0P05DRAFT_564760 [Gilbertella persicaria]|uniref:uncharacterized protein n=1 Tax=Gilbertella persicaria TaxID=101096 RepID=UPI00221E5DB3|nr:uncharacterized protein B0P05DRAFT_564760 [Gilbertella persicaria]KAI8048169.1 hypothetical protein B0P05DRAFT_564760 [Gilbertella persicaria]